MPRLKHLATILVTGFMVAACGGGTTGPTTTIGQATGTPASQASPTQAAGGGGGAIDSCTVLSAAEVGAIVGTPVKTGKTGDLCTSTGPNGNLSVIVRADDAARRSALMDMELQPGFFQAGTTAQAVSGLGDKAVLVTSETGVDLQVLKGSTLVDVSLGLTGQSADAMTNTAKQLATEILGKI